jgi:hypothetical protein
MGEMGIASKWKRRENEHAQHNSQQKNRRMEDEGIDDTADQQQRIAQRICFVFLLFSCHTSSIEHVITSERFEQ